MIRHMTASDFKEMPWANGKGTTVEMLRIDRRGRMVLRLSRAMVVEDGAFSLFPGIERSLTVVSGPGFDLVVAEARLHARPLVPVAFAGDVEIRAEMVNEQSEDFNVMTARDLPLPRVWVARGEDIPGPCALLALEAGMLCGLSVSRYDLVISDQGLRASVRGVAVSLPGWPDHGWPV